MPGVKIGVNDLYTWCLKHGDYGKQLISEFTGIGDDGRNYRINGIAAQSNKKLLWKCERGHTWVTNVQKRTLLESKCPHCAGNTVTPGTNDLYTWCKQNNREDLIQQFVGFDAMNNVVDIHKVAKSSYKKVLWKHTVDGKEHKWLAKISDRTYKNSGCPICNGRNISKPGINDLYTWCKNNGEFGQLLIKQWVGIDESGKLVNMMNKSYGASKTKVMWMCNCGNVWYSTPLQRTSQRTKVCPKCSIKQREIKRYESVLKSSETLLSWCNRSGLRGEVIKRQFTGVDENGDKVEIDRVSYGSAKIVWWEHYNKHGEHHAWLAAINNRVGNGSNCPYCNTRSTSLNEQIIYRALKQLYPDTVSRQKYNGYEIDISIPSANLYIEYGSKFFHTGREQRDKEKRDMCKSNGWRFLQIIDDRESNNTFINDTMTINFVKTSIKDIINFIIKHYNLCGTPDMDKAILESKEYMDNF